MGICLGYLCKVFIKVWENFYCNRLLLSENVWFESIEKVGFRYVIWRIFYYSFIFLFKEWKRSGGWEYGWKISSFGYKKRAISLSV